MNQNKMRQSNVRFGDEKENGSTSDQQNAPENKVILSAMQKANAKPPKPILKPR